MVFLLQHCYSSIFNPKRTIVLSVEDVNDVCCLALWRRISLWRPAEQPDLRQRDFHQEAGRWSPPGRQADWTRATEEEPGGGRGGANLSPVLCCQSQDLLLSTVSPHLMVFTTPRLNRKGRNYYFYSCLTFKTSAFWNWLILIVIYLKSDYLIFFILRSGHNETDEDLPELYNTVKKWHVYQCLL